MKHVLQNEIQSISDLIFLFLYMYSYLVYINTEKKKKKTCEHDTTKSDHMVKLCLQVSGWKGFQVFHAPEAKMIKWSTLYIGVIIISHLSFDYFTSHVFYNFFSLTYWYIHTEMPHHHKIFTRFSSW
jgi:hypothetical protein